VSDGQDLWLYDEDLRQVVVRDLDPRLSHTPMLLLSGDADQVGARYAVSRPTPDTFELRPRDPDAPFRALRMEFAPEGDGTRLERLVITDALDQSTRIAFDDVRPGAAVPDEAFTFEVPDGVELVDERGA
jgi:outer membrane lipoprotein carrier protein